MLTCLKKHWAKFVLLAIVISVGFFTLLYFLIDEDPAYCFPDENIGFVRVHGEIDIFEEPEYRVISSEMVVRDIEWYLEEPGVKGIIVSLDSWGGAPVASEEIMKAIKRSHKPIAVVIRDAGNSGGYLAASSADRIFASRMSEVGSIAVSMSYLDRSEQYAREGAVFQELSSAPFKDSGSPARSLTEEERGMFLADLEELHQMFVKVVAENRGMEIETVEALADGSTMLGEKALEAGLIDEIGGVEEAKIWLGKTLGISPKICY